jgi:hypothetical protein
LPSLGVLTATFSMACDAGDFASGACSAQPARTDETTTTMTEAI